MHIGTFRRKEHQEQKQEELKTGSVSGEDGGDEITRELRGVMIACKRDNTIT